MSAFLLGLGFRADMGTTIRKLVLLKLIDACHDDGSKIFPALTTVAQAAQCSVRQVQREVKAFLDVGLLVMVREGGKGPGSTCEYRLDLDVLEAISKRGWDALVTPAEASAPPEYAERKGDTVSPLAADAEIKGDTGDTLRVTPTTDKGDSWSPTTPYYPLPDPSEREGAREAVSEKEDRSTIAGTADFEKRVMRFCNGRGFKAGQWPDWDTSSPGYIGKVMGKLDEDERQAAERWRDAYLQDMARRSKKPVPPGIFLRDRLWTGLDPAILLRFENKTRQVSERPDNWAPAYGPAHAAILFRILLDGPDKPDMAPENGLWLASKLRDAWPRLFNFRQVTDVKGGIMAHPGEMGLAALMEFVPASSPFMAEWTAELRRRGLPELRQPDGMAGHYFPKGGPYGLQEFERAVWAVMTAGESDEHAA